MDRYIDAKDCVAGRVASQVAKILLKGDNVFLFNANDVVISGNPKWVKEGFLYDVQKGDPYHGPFHPRESHRILKRMVKGMLPIKKPRGQEALKNLRVYPDVPEEFKDKKTEVLEKTVNKLECKYVTLDKVAGFVGSK